MALMIDNLWIAGLALMVLVTLYATVTLVGSMKRATNDNRIRRLHAEQLTVSIQKAKKQQQINSQKSLSWTGTRKFYVATKAFESDDGQVCSFYLSPHDNKAIPSFEPGQFVTFELNVPGQPHRVTRCYSLSDAPREDVYRVTIKRIGVPIGNTDVSPGVSSNFFHDQVNEGDILDVRAPSGSFFLDMNSHRPIVLIGGGVGLTPVLSMLNSVLLSGSDREVWFFYGIRRGTEHCMKQHLKTIKQQSKNIKVHICYSQPGEKDVVGEDYDHAQRVSVELFKQVLPANNFQYLICGPAAMMVSLTSDLMDWGVPKGDILSESFGPAAGRMAPVKKATSDANGPLITFKKTDKTAHWDPSFDNLVQFAQANGCEIPSACLVGNCGTCLTTVLKGDVDYQGNKPDFDYQQGTCLPCSCIPDGPVELDV